MNKNARNAHWRVGFFIVLLLASVSTLAAEPKEIVVSAAASLRNVLEAIGKKFEEKNPGVKVIFNFGASGALVNQIIGGAPVDLFFSADIREFDKLDKRKGGLFGARFPRLSATGYPKPFLRNQLVFIVPGESPLNPRAMADLKMPVWKKIAIGNPKTVPAGRYAWETLKAEGLTEAMKDRLVLCENVRQVLDYVIRAEVEGGFVYVSDAKSTKPGEVKQVFVVPSEKHSPIVYGSGRMSGAGNPDLAEKFLSFVSQPENQEILTAAGFLLPEK